MSVHIHDHHHHDDDPTDQIDRAVEAFTSELDRLEAMFSTFRPDSEISRISRGDLHLLDASQEVVDVFDACTWLEHASEGAFLIRSSDDPDRVDPAGFVKGWATERAARLLVEWGLDDWIVSAGGDVLVHGLPLGDDQWDVAIADPDDPSEPILGVRVPAGAVATSGTSQRGEHITLVDPAASNAELRSVTVTGPSLTWADAIATAVVAMGIEGIAWASRFEGHHVIAFTTDGRLLTSEAVKVDGLAPPAIG